LYYVRAVYGEGLEERAEGEEGECWVCHDVLIDCDGLEVVFGGLMEGCWWRRIVRWGGSR
jgi:hypothetical protein